jgi:hypothetical protein
MRRVEKLAHQLEKDRSQYHPFARQILNLAGQFADDEIIALIEPYLNL